MKSIARMAGMVAALASIHGTTPATVMILDQDPEPTPKPKPKHRRREKYNAPLPYKRPEPKPKSAALTRMLKQKGRK